MKSLAKNFIAPLAFAGALLLPISSSAQDKTTKVEEDKNKIHIFAGANTYAMNDAKQLPGDYGAFKGLRGGISVDLSERFRVEGFVSSAKSEGSPYYYGGSADNNAVFSGEAKMSNSQYGVSAHYLFPNKNLVFRLGAGFASREFTEELDYTVKWSWYDNEGNRQSSTDYVQENIPISANGFFAMAGLELFINKEETFIAFVEASKHLAHLKEGRDELDLGGIGLELGLKYRVK